MGVEAPDPEIALALACNRAIRRFLASLSARANMSRCSERREGPPNPDTLGEEPAGPLL